MKGAAITIESQRLQLLYACSFYTTITPIFIKNCNPFAKSSSEINP